MLVTLVTLGLLCTNSMSNIRLVVVSSTVVINTMAIMSTVNVGNSIVLYYSSSKNKNKMINVIMPYP